MALFIIKKLPNLKPLIGLIAFLGAMNLTVLSQSDTAYSFFVAGHTYGKPGANNPGFHPPFKDKFNYIQNRTEIEFGVLTGDIVSANPSEQDWEEVDADIDTLGLPVHFAVGNHDMENRPVFEARYGTTYYSFVHKKDLFIILDPNIDGWSIKGAQLDFLEAAIHDNYLNTEHIFVFFHQLLWKAGNSDFDFIKINSFAGQVNPVNFWSTIIPMFDSLPNKTFMLAGDLGASWASDVSYDRYHNVTFISTGMGDEDGENFIVVNIDSTKSVDYDIICLSDSSENCLGDLTDYLTVDVVNDIQGSQITNKNKSFLYPNPTSNSVTIDIHQASTFQVFDLTGALVFETHFGKKVAHQQIELPELAKGIYLAKLIGSKTQSTQTLFIE